MQGTVKAFVQVTPNTPLFFQGTADQLSEKVIDFSSNSDAFHISKVETNLQDKIKYQVETAEEGKHYRLKVTNIAKSGDYNGFVKLLTDHPKRPEILVRVNGMIMGDVSVRPQIVRVGKLDSNASQLRTGVVAVLNNRNGPFEITKLTYDEQLMSVTKKSVTERQGYVLEIVPKLENISQGSERQVPMTIETNVNPEEKYTVQVYILNR